MPKEKPARYRHTARPLFLPHRYDYMAVRPFSWKGQYLAPGDDVPKEWPEYHLRHLHRQSLIGPRDHTWSAQRIASWEKRLANGRKRLKAEELTDEEPKAEELTDEEPKAEELTDEEVLEPAAKEVHSLKDRFIGMFGGGDSNGGSTDNSDPT